MQVRAKQNLWLDGRLVDLGVCVDLPDERACGLCERGLAELVDAFSIPEKSDVPDDLPAEPRAVKRTKKK